MAEIVQSTEPERTAAVVRAEVPMTQLTAFFGRAFATVAKEVAEQGRQITGPPFAHYLRMPTDTVLLAAGFPVDLPVQPSGGMEPAVLPGGPAYQALHQGPYETLADTYRELEAKIAADGKHLRGGMWESYLTDPGEEPDPGKWLTQIVQPVAP